MYSFVYSLVVLAHFFSLSAFEGTINSTITVARALELQDGLGLFLLDFEVGDEFSKQTSGFVGCDTPFPRDLDLWSVSFPLSDMSAKGLVQPVDQSLVGVYYTKEPKDVLSVFVSAHTDTTFTINNTSHVGNIGFFHTSIVHWS